MLNTKTLTTQVTASMADHLDNICRVEGLSMSVLIRAAIEFYLASRK
jgi:Ribbon-helix-helix protein, copG family